MTTRKLVIPFQRNKRLKSVTMVGRPAAHTDFSPIYRSRLTAAIADARNNQWGALIGDERGTAKAPSCEKGVHVLHV